MLTDGQDEGKPIKRSIAVRGVKVEMSSRYVSEGRKEHDIFRLCGQILYLPNTTQKRY
jgi:hypothetical protein